MQNDLGKAALRCDGGGAIHEPSPDPGAPRGGAHGDAADLCGAVVVQHAERADDLIIADGDQMGGACIEFIDLELARHALLVHEYLIAQFKCVAHEVGREFNFDDPFALHLNPAGHDSSEMNHKP